MDDINFSIVIPVYNEERRLPKNIDKICQFFLTTHQKVEIIFVNDGSTDQTLAILSAYNNKYNFKIISYQKNQGKGYAVRQGALASKGDWVVFFDVDLATPLEEFNLLVETLAPGDQIVIGSRRLPASQINVRESKTRTLLGHCFTKLSNLLVPSVVDFTCGFKCFSRTAVAIIFPRARINRWGFDAELLYVGTLHYLPIKQIPVSWAHDADSKVKVFQAIFSSLWELFNMKLNQLRGLYK
ncbi:MAG: glycosyltransferase family 2 protein [Candidatus Magasanikbacteria bacterium]|nr:glycosyltransferase family 2 protein [Candidatus Magasanikbacteria bacterium]